MLKQPLLNPYNLGQPAPRPLRINVLYCAIASCVVATMGLCFAILLRRLEQSDYQASRMPRRSCRRCAQGGTRWRGSPTSFLRRQKDIREFASATFGDGSERTSLRTSEDRHRGGRKGAKPIQ